MDLRLYLIQNNFLRINIWGSGGSATIKHRCVTHLCGSNAIQQVMSFEF